MDGTPESEMVEPIDAMVAGMEKSFRDHIK
jgi:hypothetical protein